MVNLFRRGENATLVAFLAERVGFDKLVSDTFPGAAISALRVRTTVVLFVTLTFQTFVFFTKPAVCKLWTAGIGAGAFRFCRHQCSLPLNIHLPSFLSPMIS